MFRAARILRMNQLYCGDNLQVLREHMLFKSHAKIVADGRPL
jgi:hypothetical protein